MSKGSFRSGFRVRVPTISPPSTKRWATYLPVQEKAPATTSKLGWDRIKSQRLQGRVQEIRRSLTGHLYRRYLVEVMSRIDTERLPDDWLALSSEVLADILMEDSVGAPPIWCQRVTWVSYAEKRYDRVKARLLGVLRESAYAKTEGEASSGWTVDGNRIIVWEPRDAFGRRGFDWEDVPSTLIDEDASSGQGIARRLPSP